MENQVAFEIELAETDVHSFVQVLLEKLALNLPDLFIPEPIYGKSICNAQQK